MSNPDYEIPDGTHRLSEIIPELPPNAKPKTLSSIVGGGYNEFWNTRAFYRLVKGSKGSKKSYTTALWYIYHMMKYPLANTLVIRKTYNSLRTSAFATLIWAINQLGVEKYWIATTSPLQLTYEPTGQVIIFKGLDDPYKIASIGVPKGYLCWAWFEEFAEITNEQDFEKINMSIRGLIPPETGLFKQITCTFNPWSEHLWIKPRFFDRTAPNIFATTTTYKCNEFLGPEDIERYEELYITNPRQARIICDGEWGISEGLIYENWEECEFNHLDIISQPGIRVSYGLDFGFSTSANAFVPVAFNPVTHELWIWDEIYMRGVSNLQIAKELTRKGFAKERIIADSAAPKDIYELRTGQTEVDEESPEGHVTYYVPNIRQALKGSDSVINGIRRLQGFKWHVHRRCKNVITELQNYSYDQDKDGNWLDKPIKEWDHCLTGDTPVLTVDGYIPIKDIMEGDMVMTHLGPHLVTAAGITQLDAQIWRMELEDGTVLKGTWNHPIVTTDGVKYLSDVSKGNEVIVWNQKIDSKYWNLTDIYGEDTPVVLEGIQEYISDPTSTEKFTSCTDTSGKRNMDQSQREESSTTSMGILSTMTSPTSVLLHAKSMLQNTPSMRKGEGSVPKRCMGTAPSKIGVENGTDPKKDKDGTPNMERELLKILKKRNISVDTAEKFSRKNLSGKSSSVPTHVRQHTEERWVSITRAVFVNSVVRNSWLTNTQNADSVQSSVPTEAEENTYKLVKVKNVYKTDYSEPVYDLTVDLAHDFFANGILTSNCMDAVRYASEILINSGRGHVVEAKGMDVDPRHVPARRGSRRVVSTI